MVGLISRVSRSLRQTIDSCLATFLEQHGFIEDADPEAGHWTKIFRSEAFRLKFSGRGTDFNVCADPVYRSENWYWLPNVIAMMRGLDRPGDNETPADLADTLEKYYLDLERFFSPTGEPERLRFQQWATTVVATSR